MRSFWIALTYAALVGSVAQAQYIPVRVVGEGESAPGSGDSITTLSLQHNVNNLGEVAVELDDTGPVATDDFYWIVGVDSFRAGLLPLGQGATVIDFVDAIETNSQLNGSSLVWVGDDQGGDVLLLDDTALLFDGEVAPGIPGRVFNDFNEPCLTAAGDIYFRSDLDGTTTDDEAIYYIPSGGTPTLLTTMGGSPFREGELILGGPLAGSFFDDATAFVSLDCNDAGTLVMEADIETATEVAILKPLGGAYQVLLMEGDMITAPNGVMAPVENIDQVAIAKGNDNWAIDAKLDDAITGADFDDIVLVDVGSGPQVIFQQGEDVSALTGIAGTTLGFFGEIAVNANGWVVLIAQVEDNGVNVPPYEEAIFLWNAGVKSLVLTDEIVVPGTSDTITNLEDDIVINDQDRIFFQADQGTQDTVFEALLPTVQPITNLVCTVAGSQVTASWDLGQAYTGIRIFLDGIQQVPDLGGTETTYTTPVLLSNSLVEIEVIGLDGMDQAPGIPCATSFVLPPDFEECLDFVPFFAVPSPGTSTDILTLSQNVVIEDASIEVQIDHSSTFLAGIDPLEVTSPSGTTVRLHNGSGVGDSLRAIYSDFGRPNGPPFDTTDLMQVQGPGVTSDWACETSGGDWTFFLGNVSAGLSFPTLERYCVRINEETNPGPDCCAEPGPPTCTSSGACGTPPGVTITWTLNDPVFALELVRDDPMMTTIPLAPTDTSYFDPLPFGTVQTYTLNYICEMGGTLQSAGACISFHEMITPAVTDLICTSDFCANEVTVSWDTNGVPYDTVTLDRDGVFLADITGLMSFVDTAPSAGSSTYTVIAECAGNIALSNCGVTPTLPPPADLTCTIDPTLCDGVVTLSWVNGASYTNLDLFRDGVLVSPGVIPGDVTFTDDPLAAGAYTYELVGTCGVTTATATCIVAVSTPPTGLERDVILALETVSDVDSVTALQSALVAAGRQVYVATPSPSILSLPCGVDLTTFDNVWVLAGTFPDNYPMNVDELNSLASLAQLGIGIYLESADHWGFQHVDSNLDELDGIEADIGVNIGDGDDTFTSMDGLDSGIGLDLSVDFGGDAGPDMVTLLRFRGHRPKLRCARTLRDSHTRVSSAFFDGCRRLPCIHRSHAAVQIEWSIGVDRRAPA